MLGLKDFQTKIENFCIKDTLLPGYCHPGYCPHAILKTSLLSPSPNFYPVYCPQKNFTGVQNRKIGSEKNFS